MPKLYMIVRHFTSNSGSYAGFVEEFSKFANKKGYDVKILCAKVSKDLLDEENLGYAKVMRFSVPLFNIPLLGMNKDYLVLGQRVRNYFKHIKLNNEDLIIANTRAGLGIVGHRYILRMGQPAMTFLRNMEIANKEVTFVTVFARKIHFAIQKQIEKRCIKNAAGFIFSSEESKDINFKEYNLKDLPFFSPHSGVKYDELQKGRKLHYKGRLMLFVSAGEEKIRKGVVYLEKALPKIFDKYPDIKLIHVGDKFRWNIPEKHQSRIISVGRVKWDEMKDYFKSSEIIVSTSLHEMFPNTIIETMAYGLPVVTSDIQGASEYVEHLKEGYIFKRGDSEDLKKGLSFVLDNYKKIKKSSASLKKKAKKLDQQIYLKELLRFIKKNGSGEHYSKNLLETF